MLLRVESQARNQQLERGRSFEQCFKCGVCSLVCPITLYGEGYTPRESFVYDVCRSADPATNPNLWSCSLCHKCFEVCPQDVNLPEIFETLKEAAFEKGCAPPSLVSLVELVIRTGSSFPFTASSKRMRERLDLPPFAPRNVDELATISRITGLEDILGKLSARTTDE